MFHLRNGFFFERLNDGSVRIRYAQPVIDEFGNPAPAAGGGYFKAIIAQVTVPENEWASVLASVCAAGETSKTWQAAREYHATGSNPASQETAHNVSLENWHRAEAVRVAAESLRTAALTAAHRLSSDACQDVTKPMQRILNKAVEEYDVDIEAILAEAVDPDEPSDGFDLKGGRLP